MKAKKIAMFNGQRIRRVWDKKEEMWYFSVVDIVTVLTDSMDPAAYWRKLKQRLKEEGNETVTNCHALKMAALDGKMRITDVVNAEECFRLIQSIPSPKAEPFKLWLAKVGQERIAEIEDPELAQERMKLLYEAKGYPSDWIDKRLRGIAIRQNLTDEWKERGINAQSDFAILTAEISKATFGLTPDKYKKYKNLPSRSKANLRDHMSELELIFTMLGERVTTEISQAEKPGGMTANKKVAQRGGRVAGNARKETEKEIGKPVVSKSNFLNSDNKKRLKRKNQGHG